MTRETPPARPLYAGEVSDRARAAAEAARAVLPPRLATDQIVEVLVLAQYDGDFRRRLLDDPVAALESVDVEIDSADHIKIEVHERDEHTAHLIVPGVIVDTPGDAKQELTDEQMQSESGRRILWGDTTDWGDKRTEGDPKKDWSNDGDTGGDWDATTGDTTDRHDE